MPFYTEAPITSFFPPSKKRKIHTELTPSASASNKRYTSTTSRQGIISKVKEDEQERRNTFDNGAISILHSSSIEDLSTTRPAKSTQRQTIERHMSLFSSLNAKYATQTPKSNLLPSRKKRKTSLQTPPPTNEETELMEPSPTQSSFTSRKSDLRIEKFLLPTPSTLGRSTLHHNGHSNSDRSRVIQGHLPDQDPSLPPCSQHSDTSLKASIPISIPSSQSQLMVNAYSGDGHHSTPTGTAPPCEWLWLPRDEAHLSLINKIPLARRHKRDSTTYASQMFISSSQSQFLSPLDEHDPPQRSQPELDIIPSSQSQEKELRILGDMHECHGSIPSREQPLPRRTLSADLFSVSILQTDRSDNNLEPEHPIQQTTDIPRAANNGDDSETEPETEEQDSYYQNHRLTPTQDLSLAEQSLPSAVKEFQNMFGPDESYPPDFPMSLR